MESSRKLKNYLHLHFLVFIAGFTAVLGELISIKAIPLVSNANRFSVNDNLYIGF